MYQPNSHTKAAPYEWGQLIFDALATTFVIGVWGAILSLMTLKWVMP